MHLKLVLYAALLFLYIKILYNGFSKYNVQLKYNSHGYTKTFFSMIIINIITIVVFLVSCALWL